MSTGLSSAAAIIDMVSTPNTRPKIRITLNSDVTGLTVTANLKKPDATVVNPTVTVITAATGVVDVEFATGELAAGTSELEIKTDDGAGAIQTYPRKGPIALNTRAALA